MQNKKASRGQANNSKYGHALEELCSVSTEEMSKKVFGRQYSKILEELSYILENGHKSVLDYSYILNTEELKGVTKEYMHSIFEKGLKKVEYSRFSIDFNDKRQVKTGIYGYTVAHVYKILFKQDNGTKPKK
ncbi:hypothetical protein M1494_01355 [Candidatus Parvarchaeota archaeon]|nr:hypothetical protein [Candidatus Parvarchaeota archaeon]